MKLVKPIAHTDDSVHRSERETYLTHCTNIANIIAAAVGRKVADRQELVDLYLTSVNTEIES